MFLFPLPDLELQSAFRFQGTVKGSGHCRELRLAPIVTFATLASAPLDIVNSALVFSSVGADKSDVSFARLDGSALIRSDTAGHLVWLDGATAVRINVVISILFLLTVTGSTGLLATLQVPPSLPRL